MNLGKFLYVVGIDWSPATPESERGAYPSAILYKIANGYIVTKKGIRFGVYRCTNAQGTKEYASVDLRDGWEEARGKTLHEVIRNTELLSARDFVLDDERMYYYNEMVKKIAELGDEEITKPNL